MFVFDGHNDALLRLAQHDGDACALFGQKAGHVNLPDMQAGGMLGGFFAMFALDEHFSMDFGIFNDPPYDTPLPPMMTRDVAWSKIMKQAQIAQELERKGLIRWMRSTEDLMLSTHTPSGVLHLEGAECIGDDLEDLETLFDLGLRSVGPVWSRPTVFAHGVPFRFPSDGDTGPGLTAPGKRLVQALKSRGMVTDTSHMTLKGFWDVADEGAPLVATHSNAHYISQTARNLTDDQLRAIGQTKGMVGLNFATVFLRPDGKNIASNAMDHMIPHLDHMIALAGEDHVGLGSDFDGAPMPDGMESAAKLPTLIHEMQRSGYGQELIEKICNKNWLACLRRHMEGQS